MYGRERLIVSAVAVALPGVIVAQVAAALGCAAAGHRAEAPAIGIAVFALVITALQGWLGWLLRGGAFVVLKRCFTAVFPAAIAWVGIALVREQSLSGVYQASVAISGIVLSVVSLVSAFVMPLLAAKLSGDLDGAFSRRRGLSIVWAIIALLALGQGARLSIFMADIDQKWASAFPPSEHVVHHQCLAGYVRAGEMSRQGEANLWDPNHYPSAAGLPEPPESSVEELGPYLGDRYLYPPPFILVPRGLLAITNSFMDIRILVFGINALGLFAVPFLLACWIGGREGLGAGLLLPAIWLNVGTIVTLQFGQVHLLVVVTAVMGMILIEKNWPSLGGLLLAIAIVSKIFPGMLVLYLLMSRRWKAVIWTCAGVAILVLLTLGVAGWESFEFFFDYHLPRMASGEAVIATDPSPLAIVFSGSIRAIPYKLRELGITVPEDIGWLISCVYAGVVIVLTLIAALRGGDRRNRAAQWLAVILLASLGGPSGPTAYIFIPALWVATLYPPRGRGLRVWGFGLFMLIAIFALGPLPPVNPGKILMALSFAGPVLAIGLSVRAIIFQSKAMSIDPVSEGDTLQET